MLIVFDSEDENPFFDKILQQDSVKHIFQTEQFTQEQLKKFYSQFDSLKDYIHDLLSKHPQFRNSENQDDFVCCYEHFLKNPKYQNFTEIRKLVAWMLCLNITNAHIERCSISFFLLIVIFWPIASEQCWSLCLFLHSCGVHPQPAKLYVLNNHLQSMTVNSEKI